MFLPEPMSRIVIFGVKDTLKEAVEAFFEEEQIYVIDHTSGEDGMTVAPSDPETPKASERLLKVKSLEKELGIKRKTKTETLPVEEIRNRIDSGEVEKIEEEVLAVIKEKDGLEAHLAELFAKKDSLKLLSRLPLALNLYSGYKSIGVAVGTVRIVPTLSDDILLFTSFNSKEGNVIAVFFPIAKKEEIYNTLSQYDFNEIDVPVETVPINAFDQEMKTREEIEKTKQDIDNVEVKLLELKQKYRAVLKGFDEELTIQIQKGTTPMRVGISDHSYLLDGWVPTKQQKKVKQDLEKKLGINNVHVEIIENKGRKQEVLEHREPRFRNVPTKQNNGKIASEFEYATGLVSVPKYQEIDPTFLVMIFLPLFFGIMVGDAGYAIPFIVLGAYGLKKTQNKDWRSIALVLFLGGIWSFIFGFLFYGEMLGMHFVGGYWVDGIWHWNHDHVAVGGTAVSWDWLLGGHFPDWFNFICHVEVGSHHVGVGKLEDVGFLLKLSVYIGIVHLFIGHLCGLYNKYNQYDAKHAFIEKGGVVCQFFGMIFLCYALTNFMFSKIDLFSGITFYSFIAGIGLLVVGTGINIKAEGAMQAVLGLPEHLGQILSYTRLAAIGMSKAGMALAFNFIVFSMIMPTTQVDGVTYLDPGSNLILVILGLVIFAFLHLVIWTLAILSAGIHALRLQFVELMMRFFDGGGTPFAPLKEGRVKTFYKNKIESIEV